MDFVLIDKESPAWEEIWQWLEQHPINEGLTEPSVALNQGQSWQYVGSYKQDDKVITQFRHRLHPKTNDVYTASYSHSITDEQIKKKFKI